MQFERVETLNKLRNGLLKRATELVTISNEVYRLLSQCGEELNKPSWESDLPYSLPTSAKSPLTPPSPLRPENEEEERKTGWQIDRQSNGETDLQTETVVVFLNTVTEIS